MWSHVKNCTSSDSWRTHLIFLISVERSRLLAMCSWCLLYFYVRFLTMNCQNSNRAPIGLQWGKQIRRFLCCSCFFNVSRGFMGFLLFPNAWLSIPDRLQYFLNVFWNFQNSEICWTRSGPLDPVFIIKIRKKPKINRESSLTGINSSYLIIHNFDIYGSTVYLTFRFLKFINIKMLNLWKLEIWRF